MIQGQELVQLLTNAKPTPPQNNPVNVDTIQIVEQFRRLQPPCFEGSIDPLLAEDWVQELEKIFDLIECPDALRVSSATFMLKGSASNWWNMTKRVHNVEGNGITWAQFKELFYEKYFSQSLKVDKEIEFTQLTQDSMSLMEYERKFEALSRFAPHLVDTEERKAKRFERGLKPELRKHISVLELKTYSEVLQKAQILAKDDEFIEATKSKNEALNPQQKNSCGWNNRKMFDQWKGKKRKQSENSGKKEYPVCDTCQKWHEGTCFKKTGACFNCGSSGHLISQCPELKKDQGSSRKNQRTRRRVYTLTAQEVRDSPSVVSGTFEHVNETMMANINMSTSMVSLDSLDQGGARTVDSNMDMPQAPMNQQNITSLDGPVAILWDIENCCVPSDVRPEDVAGNIRMALRVHPVIKGAVMMFSAYGDFNAFPRRLREGCQRTGVKLIDVPNGRKDAADKAILVDMFLFALDNRPPSSIMLISGDVDFAPALHILGQRGYTVILVIPSRVGVSSALCSAGKFVCDWPSMARGEGFVPPTKSFMPPRGGPDFAGYSMGCHINDNIDASKEEAIFYRGILQNYYKSWDFPMMSQSLSDYTSTSMNMPCFPTNLRTQSLPSVLNEVSAGPVSTADQNDCAMLVQPGEINDLKVQLVKLLELSGGCLRLTRVYPEYRKLFGKPLHASDYGTRKLVNLLKKLGDTVAIEGEGARKFVRLRDWKGCSSAILAEDEKAKGSREENMNVTAGSGSSDDEREGCLA